MVHAGLHGIGPCLYLLILEIPPILLDPLNSPEVFLPPHLFIFVLAVFIIDLTLCSRTTSFNVIFRATDTPEIYFVKGGLSLRGGRVVGGGEAELSLCGKVLLLRFH